MVRILSGREALLPGWRASRISTIDNEDNGWNQGEGFGAGADGR